MLSFPLGSCISKLEGNESTLRMPRLIKKKIIAIIKKKVGVNLLFPLTGFHIFKNSDHISPLRSFHDFKWNSTVKVASIFTWKVSIKGKKLFGKRTVQLHIFLSPLFTTTTSESCSWGKSHATKICKCCCSSPPPNTQ